jgi:biopolymer transport protein TolQ
MGQDLSILQLILSASLVVKLVLIILLIFSILSWGIIFTKTFSLSKIYLQLNLFHKKFNNMSNNISELYNTTYCDNIRASARIFCLSLKEYNLLVKQNIRNNQIIMQNVERKILSVIDEEVTICENGISVLATFGSVSPYIGLLGTVWGIMSAFIGIGNIGQATLASVAPGIAEALVTTAFGLFVAIPAYIFYNKFTTKINLITTKMTTFGDELLNMINSRIETKLRDNNETE